MPDKPDFDNTAVHKYFSADCFNKAWDLIEKPNRTDEENEKMVLLNQASIFHWMQRDDCSNQQKSIGYWQASRIHSITKQPEAAKKYGELCLKYSQGLEPFFLGYAYEALARAEQTAGNSNKMTEYLNLAKAEAEKVTDTESKKMLTDDLIAIK